MVKSDEFSSSKMSSLDLNIPLQDISRPKSSVENLEKSTCTSSIVDGRDFSFPDSCLGSLKTLGSKLYLFILMLENF